MSSSDSFQLSYSRDLISINWQLTYPSFTPRLGERSAILRNMMDKKLAFFFVVIGVLIPAGYGLKCYVCNSMEDSRGCGKGEDVDIRYLKECDDPENTPDRVHGVRYDICRKFVTIVEFDVNENKAQDRVTRKCGYLNSTYDETCYYRAGFGGRQTVCSCKTQGCNSSSGLSGNAFIVIGLGSIFTFFMLK